MHLNAICLKGNLENFICTQSKPSVGFKLLGKPPTQTQAELSHSVTRHVPHILFCSQQESLEFLSTKPDRGLYNTLMQAISSVSCIKGHITFPIPITSKRGCVVSCVP